MVEDLELKKRVFRDLEAHTRPETLLATNTSSLGVVNIQKGLAHPERVAALHFFNPVHKMPLIEVAHARDTTPSVTASLTQWAIKLGKTPVVVKDSPGFVVNRILIPYLNEAVLLVAEGMSPEAVDHAMKRFGMLAGPLEVIDQVGLDVAAHIASRVQPAFADRFPPNPAFAAMVQHGLLGQKSVKGGFYTYTGKKKSVNAAAVAVVRAGSVSDGNNRR